MLLKYFYDEKLAHASYMVGCQRSSTACVVDPGRDIEQYLEAARENGLVITDVAETHIHADYVSGARELAERVGATLHVSDEGPADWKYLFLESYDHQLCKDGDKFKVGNIQFEVMHTPGHTPESISFLLTDQGGGATSPMGIFTGDFVFVGSIGRPDLLEEAAGQANTAEPGARDLYQSIQKFKELPDHLQVWPAHGAGSACGKGLGAIPSSTVGYEKRYNPALNYDDESSFVKYILADQPEAPKYFATMKRVNKEGPQILGADHRVPSLAVDQLEHAVENGIVLDLRPVSDFAAAHVPGTLNVPLDSLSPWAGWLVDYDQPTFLIGDVNQLAEAARVLHKIGCDHIQGAFAQDDVKRDGYLTESYQSSNPEQLSDAIVSGGAYLVDVRSQEEWNEGCITNAHHHFLGRLPESVRSIPQDKKVIVQCRSGTRSAIAASLLQAIGFKEVINLEGGYKAWLNAGLPTSTESESDTAGSTPIRKEHDRHDRVNIKAATGRSTERSRNRRGAASTD